MNKEQYLAALKSGLCDLPDADINRSIEYYSEMIDDRIEEGDSEEEAVGAMDAPEDAVRQILLATPLPRLVKAKAKRRRSLRAWEIVLLVLGAPLWLPLLMAALVILLSIYISFWAVIVSLYAVDLSVAVFALSTIFCAVVAAACGSMTGAVFSIGVGITALGLAPLMFFLFNKISALLIRFGKAFIRWVKSMFIGKDNN